MEGGEETLIYFWQKEPQFNRFRGSLEKLKVELSYDPAIAFLGICPKEC
jgi:hypothetical protein